MIAFEVKAYSLGCGAGKPEFFLKTSYFLHHDWKEDFVETG